MKRALQFLATLVLVLCVGTVMAQNIKEITLDGKVNGANLISGSGAQSDPGDIFVGPVPANSSTRPVLVFVHGYTGNAYTWLSESGNDIWQRAYNAGYRTAFVTVYPDQDLWDNAILLRDLTNAVRGYYGVNKVVMIGHSKGGLDSDAMVTWLGYHPYVDRVITLGSPHYGSPLADLAQGLGFIAGLFGQNNDATYILQTGYMNSVRSYFAGLTSRPFYTLGGWDYDYFSSLGPSGTLLSSSGYSYFWGGGGNDGVVPYNFSKRPGAGAEMYSSGSSRTKYDHFELNEGPNVWNTIQERLPSTLTRESNVTAEVPQFNPNAVVTSRMMVFAAESGKTFIPVEEGVKNVTVDIRTADDYKAGVVALPNSGARVAQRAAQKASDGILGRFSTQAELTGDLNGGFEVEGEGAYVAMVSVPEGGYAEFSSDLNDAKLAYNVGEAMNLTVRLVDASGNAISGAQVAGTMRRTGNFEGRDLEAVAENVVFEATGEPGVYTFRSGAMIQDGVYNVTIQAEKGNFVRTISTSVGVMAREEIKGQLTDAEISEVRAFPNPVTDEANISFTAEAAQQMSLTVIDLMGRVVSQQTIEAVAGKNIVSWNASNQAAGTYIFRLKGQGVEQSGKLIVVK